MVNNCLATYVRSVQPSNLSGFTQKLYGSTEQLIYGDGLIKTQEQLNAFLPQQMAGVNFIAFSLKTSDGSLEVVSGNITFAPNLSYESYTCNLILTEFNIDYMEWLASTGSPNNDFVIEMTFGGEDGSISSAYGGLAFRIWYYSPALGSINCFEIQIEKFSGSKYSGRILHYGSIGNPYSFAALNFCEGLRITGKSGDRKVALAYRDVSSKANLSAETWDSYTLQGYEWTVGSAW